MMANIPNRDANMPAHILRLKHRLIDTSLPRVMAIINTTPDSFYDGGRVADVASLYQAIDIHIAEGADIIDIGGYSTRPGATDVTVEEEIERISPAIDYLNQEYPECFFSVDTFRPEVAAYALQRGACMVNDVSGGSEAMYAVVAEHRAAYVLMHSRGTPQTMQTLTQYQDLMPELIDYLSSRLYLLRQAGVVDVIVDPGVGFAKTVAQNFEIIRNLERMRILDCPILVGLSRKSFLYKTLGISPDQALNATSAMHMAALHGGAALLRVHDVAAAQQTISLYKHLRG